MKQSKHGRNKFDLSKVDQNFLDISREYFASAEFDVFRRKYSHLIDESKYVKSYLIKFEYDSEEIYSRLCNEPITIRYLQILKESDKSFFKYFTEYLSDDTVTIPRFKPRVLHLRVNTRKDKIEYYEKTNYSVVEQNGLAYM